jgi:hypothetical protein
MRTGTNSIQTLIFFSLLESVLLLFAAPANAGRSWLEEALPPERLTVNATDDRVIVEVRYLAGFDTLAEPFFEQALRKNGWCVGSGGAPKSALRRLVLGSTAVAGNLMSIIYGKLSLRPGSTAWLIDKASADKSGKSIDTNIHAKKPLVFEGPVRIHPVPMILRSDGSLAAPEWADLGAPAQVRVEVGTFVDPCTDKGDGLVGQRGSVSLHYRVWVSSAYELGVRTELSNDWNLVAASPSALVLPDHPIALNWSVGPDFRSNTEKLVSLLETKKRTEKWEAAISSLKYSPVGVDTKSLRLSKGSLEGRELISYAKTETKWNKPIITGQEKYWDPMWDSEGLQSGIAQVVLGVADAVERPNNQLLFKLHERYRELGSKTDSTEISQLARDPARQQFLARAWQLESDFIVKTVTWPFKEQWSLGDFGKTVRRSLVGEANAGTAQIASFLMTAVAIAGAGYAMDKGNGQMVSVMNDMMTKSLSSLDEIETASVNRLKGGEVQAEWALEWSDKVVPVSAQSWVELHEKFATLYRDSFLQKSPVLK